MFSNIALIALSIVSLLTYESQCAVQSKDIPIIGGHYSLHFVENITVPLHPGYTQFPPEFPGKMVVTSFEATPFVGKNALYVYDTSNTSAGMQMIPGSNKINWPNAVTGIDASVFGFSAVIVGDGFLVPSHTTGGLWVLEPSGSPTHLSEPVKITKDKADALPDSGWFYHQGELVDMNGDGRKDVLTARCQYGVWPWAKKNGELLWLQNPESDPLSGTPWEEHHLASGPDFTFCMKPGPGPLELVAPQFINEEIVYYYVKNGTFLSRVLDVHSGPGFSCSYADLNGDGSLDLLVTNHENANGSVYAYSFSSDDWSTASVKRHVLASGFSAVTTKTGTASPGDAVAFQPRIGANGKPHIFVSGDNSNSIFVLVPESQDRNEWSYSKQEIAYIGADIGRPSIIDMGKDGFPDLFVPAYDNDVIVHYEFAQTGPKGDLLVV